MQEEISLLPGSGADRRKFITDSAKVVGSALLFSSPLLSTASGLIKPVESVTVGQIMDLFMKQVAGGPIANTVDTLKAGNRDIVVTSIVTTMFPTIEVIRKTIALGANFILCHEPTFYNHQDETKWLENDEVYQYKANLLKEHNIAVWRNHDHIHRIHPDGVRKALVEKLGWLKYGDPDQAIYNLTPVATLKTLIASLKEKLHLQGVRYIGTLDQPCKKVLLMPGAAGTRQIESLSKNKPDVLVTGEISEWETAEYVRDARAKGEQLSLVIVGHIPSEEPGSGFMAEWLREKFPVIKTTFIESGNSLSFL